MREPVPSPCNLSESTDCFVDPHLDSLQDTNVALSKFPSFFLEEPHFSPTYPLDADTLFALAQGAC